MSKILYFDCFAGASGDMILGALVDAGLPLEALEAALGSLMIPGYRLSADRVLRSGLSATKFRVHESGGHEHHAHDRPHDHAHDHARAHHHGDSHGHAEGPASVAGDDGASVPATDRASVPAEDAATQAHSHDAHDHGHAHAHDHVHGHAHDHGPGDAAADIHRSEQGFSPAHQHHTLSEISSLIHQSSLSPSAKARAVALFERLARAEAEIHQMPVERVHLHEVGALDSIIDIVGAVFAMEWVRADRVLASPLNVGGGMVKSAHGVFPVPAPATVRLLAGVPVYSSGVQMETVTPTGALLISAYASGYGPLPAMTVERAGYGAGDRDLPGTPNVLRVLVGTDEGDIPGERVVLLECEIDDMNPQIFGVLMDRLYAAGALEVFYTPVQMKKNRPGTLLSAVGRPESRERLMGVLFRESTTIGLRYQEVNRACLEREMVMVDTPVGPVRFKVARRGSEVMNASPEFEDCARLAAERNLPVKDVQAQAVQAYLAQAGRLTGR